MGHLHRFTALIVAVALVIAAAPTIARSERRIALVIGNDEYAQLAPLAKAVADAETYAGLFRAKGFDQVTLKTNLTRGAMDEAIAAFIEGIEPGDTAVFSYSGHGWSDGTQNFIVGTDAPNAGGAEYLARISIPLRNGLSGVIDDMDRHGAGLKVAIIDACRDNPFAPQQGKRGAGISRGLSRIDPPEGTFVVYSAASAQSSLDRLSDADTNPNGVFTRVFAPLLAKDMSLQEAVKEAQREVVALARSVEEEQKPAYYDEVIGRACLSDACEHPVAATAPDEETWARIASSRDAADFESFVRIFPDSPHRGEADAKVKALREATGTEVAALPAAAPEVSTASAPATECDRLAASRYGTDNPPDVVPVPVSALTQNTSAAIAACREAVEKSPGVARLNFQLGRALNAAGENAEAKTWYEKAADLGSAVAMNNLGTLYNAGQGGIALNADEAARWFRKAADLGQPIAMMNLAQSYAAGTGVPQSDTEARAWFQKAADLGEVEAMNGFAELSENPHEGQPDYAEAQRWYMKAADGGSANAMNRLGTYAESGAAGAVDLEEARRWYQKSADLGDDSGMTYLANLYADGKGGAQDYAEAVRLFRSAVDLGNSGAMYRLGQLYVDGHGVPKDDVEARRLFQQSADLQNILAVADLGLMAAEGRGGPKDTKLATDSLIRAMEIGIPTTIERIKEEGAKIDPEVWRALQEYLAKFGLYTASADGVYGESTKAALDAYREAQKQQSNQQ